MPPLVTGVAKVRKNSEGEKGCWLLAVGYWLLAVGFWLLAVGWGADSKASALLSRAIGSSSFGDGIQSARPQAWCRQEPSEGPPRAQAAESHSVECAANGFHSTRVFAGGSSHYTICFANCQNHSPLAQ